MDQSIIDLYDEYTHAPLSRRVFLERLARLAGGGAAAAALLVLLENDYARAAMVGEDDARIETATVGYSDAAVEILGYLAKPKGGTELPAVIVIHENRGLNPHIEDVARRLAVAGFLALAPDMLSPLGGTPADEDQARQMIRGLDKAATLDHLLAALPYLAGRSDASGRVGCVGFCWGGGMASGLAVNAPGLAAAVSYYGRQPAAETVPRIKARLLLHYAGLDQRINAGIPAFEAALKAAGSDYTLYLYEGANHAFNNDTNAARYDPAAAELAWSRTIAFLTDALGG
jgi:carboxymethylenebutenolidase